MKASTSILSYQLPLQTDGSSCCEMHARYHPAEQWNTASVPKKPNNSCWGTSKVLPRTTHCPVGGKYRGQDQRFIRRDATTLICTIELLMTDQGAGQGTHTPRKSQKIGQPSPSDITDSINELRYYREAIMVLQVRADEARKVRMNRVVRRARTVQRRIRQNKISIY